MIYAFASLTVADHASLDAYREKAGDALARHGGKVEATTKNPVALDGSPALPDIGALLSFPDKDAAMRWINDPALADTHALRRNAGASDIVLMA